MTISGGLSSALSGLTAAARAAEIVASNISNATTEGYGRRELVVSARVVGSSGQGVQVRGVLRHHDPVVTGDRRQADAQTADRETRAAFLGRVEQSIGTPDQAHSLTARIAALDSALIEASGRPASESRLAAVLEAAKGLTRRFGEIADTIQAARGTADATIAADVTRLNTTLEAIAEINAKVRSGLGAGRDTSALADQRQQLIDGIAAIVPLREVDRGQGQIALFTTGGAMLLDGSPARLGFDPAAMVLPGSTVGSGALSGLTLNGRAVDPASGLLSGGRLGALFAIRDDLGVQAQTRLDAVARDLAERFAAADATLAPGAPGLFTDAGQPVLAANEAGLSQRLAVAAGADPARGGQLWRLRDGLGAGTPGPSGEAGLLVALQSAMEAARAPASGGFMAGARSLAALTADLTSGLSAARLGMEEEAGFAAARATALKSAELQGGVDTDHEMQMLLQIEKAYAANAKVISTIDELVQMLLGL